MGNSDILFIGAMLSQRYNARESGLGINLHIRLNEAREGTISTASGRVDLEQQFAAFRSETMWACLMEACFMQLRNVFFGPGVVWDVFCRGNFDRGLNHIVSCFIALCSTAKTAINSFVR